MAEQKYKFATRSYSGAVPTTTVADLKISFTVNLNEENNMYVYNTLRGWFDLAYDPLTGRQGLKKDYYGQIYLGIANKAGAIFREFKFTPVIPGEKMNAIELTYTDPNLYEITATFRADAWKETRIGEIKI